MVQDEAYGVVEGGRPALALTFDVDADEVWLADDPEYANQPVARSQGLYDIRRGVPEVLKLLEAVQLTATFFVPGRVAERFPETVERIVGEGHELGLHGYTHRSPAGMRRDSERDELRRSLDILSAFGTSITGYRSPSWEISSATLELLEEAGVRYSSNFMDDIHPYLHPGSDIVELPVHWSLDDAAHFWFSNASWDKKISTNSEVLEIWGTELSGIAELGGTCVLTMHPQIIGRPGRLAVLKSFIQQAREIRSLEILTCGEIARQVIQRGRAQ